MNEQDQRGHLGPGDGFIELPAHGDAIAKAQLLDAQVTPRQLDLVGQRAAQVLELVAWMVEPRGIEPLTSSLRTTRSPI